MHGLHGDRADFEAGTGVACRYVAAARIQRQFDKLMGSFDQDIPFMCTAI
jgi:hypothetical protein